MPRLIAAYSMNVGAGLLYAVALKYFVLPSQVILTGSEGIAAALSYYFESYWLFVVLYLVFQCALIGFAFHSVSRVFAGRTLVVVGTVIAGLTLLPELQFAQPEPQNERIILVLFGGLLAGTAKAIEFQNRGSTGDEDILGAYFASKYLKPVGSVAIIAAVVSTAFGLGLDLLKHGEFESVVNKLMYTCIYIFAMAETLNNVYHKFKLTILVIVTRKREQIGKAIKSALSYRTYTVTPGVGGHSGESIWIIRTIVTREELPQMIESVISADPSCFYYHHEVEGVSSRFYISPIG